MSAIVPVAGIDAGAYYTKVVIVEDGTVKSREIGPTNKNFRETIEGVMKKALSSAGLSQGDISSTVSTGLGKKQSPYGTKRVSEIVSQSRAIRKLVPSARSIFDLGGQDIRSCSLRDGKIGQFVSGDKNMTRVGRFFEDVAGITGVKMADWGSLIREADKIVPIAGVGPDTAQADILSLLAEGTPVANILAGLNETFADRVCGVIGGIKVEKDVVLTGGLAVNDWFKKALEKRIGCEVIVPEHPIYSAAFGAALIAKENA